VVSCDAMLNISVYRNHRPGRNAWGNLIRRRRE